MTEKEALRAAAHPGPEGARQRNEGGIHVIRRLHTRLHANPVTGLVTKVVVSVVGVAVIVAGLVMMVAPGPGIVAIILGLAILSTEWSWAEKALGKAKGYAHDAAEKARNMDPKVRQRRLVLSGLTVLLVCGAVTMYVVVFDWPGFAVSGWNWLQDLSSVVPDLPGM